MTEGPPAGPGSGVNGPPPRGEIFSSRLCSTPHQPLKPKGSSGEVAVECAVAREALQQDQAPASVHAPNMSTALTRWCISTSGNHRAASIPVPSIGFGVVGALGGYGRNLDGSRGGHRSAAVAQDAGGLSSTPYDPTGNCPVGIIVGTAPGAHLLENVAVVGKASRSVGCTIGSWSISGISFRCDCPINAKQSRN